MIRRGTAKLRRGRGVAIRVTKFVRLDCKVKFPFPGSKWNHIDNLDEFFERVSQANSRADIVTSCTFINNTGLRVPAEEWIGGHFPWGCAGVDVSWSDHVC